MNSGNRRRKGKLCFALAAIMLLLAGCAAGGASESSAAEKTDVASSPEEEQRVTSGGGNTTATLSQSEGVFDLEKRTVLLNSGYEMPVIGLGTWTLSDDEAEKSVYHALKSGMRLIDTARYYADFKKRSTRESSHGKKYSSPPRFTAATTNVQAGSLRTP